MLSAQYVPPLSAALGAHLRRRIRAEADRGRRLDPDVQHTLERGLSADLSAVRVHTGPAADALARALHADAFTCGAQIFFRAGAYRPDTTAGLRLLAHEMAHVLQQARGSVRGRVLPGSLVLTAPDDPSEREAERRAACVLAGRPSDAVAGASTRPTPLGPDFSTGPLIIQRHSSFEHRLLGDGKTADLVAISTKTSNAPAILKLQIQLLAKWQNSPQQVTEQDITSLCPWIRTLRLGPDNVLLTYGELNALPDYLANPTSIETLPESILLPILQVIRQEGFNQLTYLLQGTNPNVTFARAACAPWSWSLVNNIVETTALDQLTMALGVASSDHYQGLLARNACHFAPYSWFRWQSSHLIARDLAARAYAATDSSVRAELTHLAWVYHGYADHFLQDSFAAGHLVNKTQIMQWFVEWAATSSFPFPDWDLIKNMTVAHQPGLSAQQLYSPTYPGASSDPQTTNEYATYGGRLRASRVVADGSTSQDTAYQNYMTFLASAATQLASGNVHDYFNDNSVWVSSNAQPTPYEIWGDSTLFSGSNGGNGVQNTSATAQMSQQALLDLLNTGRTSITVQGIRDWFPTKAGADAAHQQDLQTWANGLKSFCTGTSFPGFMATLSSLLVKLVSPRLGIVSADQEFTNVWGASLPNARYTAVDVLVSGGRVFAGSYGYVFELDPTTGDVLHSLLVTGSVGVGDYTTRLATDGQNLFVGVHGYVYGVPLSSWKTAWSASLPSAGYNVVDVLASGGRLFAGSNGYVYELDPGSGGVRHSLLLASIFGTGDYTTRLATDGQNLYAGIHGYVYQVPLNTWKAGWDTSLPKAGYTVVNVLFSGGRLFAGSNGYVYQLDPSSGNVLHSLLVTSSVGVGDYSTRLATDDRSLYVGVHGYVYRVPLASWTTAWSASLSGLSYSAVDVICSEGRVYAGSNGYVYEIDPASGALRHSVLIAMAIGVGDYTTRVATNAGDLEVGTHGYGYRMHVREDDYSIIGVGTDNQLYKRASLSSNWVQVPNSGAMIDVAVLQDGSILGVGTNNQLYTRANVATWTNLANSGTVIDVASMANGTLVGVGTNSQLYTWDKQSNQWLNVPNSGSAIGVAAMANGTILGVGTDNQLYTRATLNDNWVNVPSSGAVTAVTLLPDGTIVGIGMNKDLWTRATLTSNWVNVPNSGSVVSIATMLDGSILAVGTDNQLYTRATLTSNWVNVPSSGPVVGVTVMPDGTIVGIGTNQQLYTLPALTSTWTNVPNSGEVIGAAVMPDGTVLGIGMNKDLWTRKPLSGNWVNVPNSGSVISVAVLSDGTIVGVGTDNQLYTRATLTSNWVNVPNSGSVIGVTALPDGSLLGIGMNEDLWTRATLTSNWVNVPNSGTVIAVVADSVPTSVAQAAVAATHAAVPV